jgi:hypothetical protein
MIPGPHPPGCQTYGAAGRDPASDIPLLRLLVGQRPPVTAEQKYRSCSVDCIAVIASCHAHGISSFAAKRLVARLKTHSLAVVSQTNELPSVARPGEFFAGTPRRARAPGRYATVWRKTSAGSTLGGVDLHL